jgi:hypothetical protein
MTILIIILLVIAVPCIAALFLSSDYCIEKEIVIDKPKQDVFNYVKQLKNNVHYNKWSMADPAMKLEYSGVDGTVGFISAWDSSNKNVGKGEQEIIKVEEGRRVDFALRFIKPFENKANAYFITEALSNDQTKVTWAFTGTRNYTNRIMHVMLNLKKMLGNDLGTGLNTLKNVLEHTK